MTSQSAGSVPGLFKTAKNEGVLSAAALTAINVNDIGAEINAALGVSVDDVTAGEVTLVTPLLDDSSSIAQVKGNAQAVRDGHNLIIDSLSKTKARQKDGILASTSYLNRGLLYPYCVVEQAVRLDDNNFRPNGGTPLYDKSIVTLGTVIAKWQEFTANGVTCRTVTPIVTDGADWGSSKTARDVKKVVDDMLRQECHIIAGVGIWDGKLDGNGDPIPGTGTDFKQVFGEMGIRPEWILTPQNTPSEIRRAFNMLSQSAVRASQAAGANFSQAAMGGFGSP